LMKLMCAKGDAVLDTLRDIDGAGVLMTALRGHAPNFMVQVGALRVSRRGGAKDVRGAMGGGLTPGGVAAVCHLQYRALQALVCLSSR
jgi:hypothetical protein